MQTMGRTKGFTLIEIAVCIAIAAVLTAAVLPSLMQSYQHHKIFSSIEQAKNLVPICEIARTRQPVPRLEQTSRPLTPTALSPVGRRRRFCKAFWAMTIAFQQRTHLDQTFL